MNSNTFKQIEIMLSEYPKYEQYIKSREEELTNPYQITDTNQGGGQSNMTSDTTGLKAITLAEDRVLQRLKFQHRAIKRTYDAADPSVQKMIKEYYFTKPRTRTWSGVADYVGWSRSQCFNLRNAFFSQLADELGLMK